MIMMVLLLLVMPACATVAGLAVWASHREDVLTDGALIRRFLFMLVICHVFVLGAIRTDAVRLYIDPQFRVLTALEAHPVYAVIKRTVPDDHAQLHNFLVLQTPHDEVELSAAFVQARPLLTSLANNRLGFADHEARLAWGRVTVDTLKELQANDPMSCYRALSGRPLDRQLPAFSAENATAFEQAIVKIYESADPYKRNERPPGYKSADFHETALEYRGIRQAVVERFGEPVAEILSKRAFAEPATEPPEDICGARIFQLEAMLERPEEMASLMLDSALR